MKSLTFILFFAVCALACAKPNGYTTKYDNIDVDRILNNDRLLRSYVNCLLDRGRCTNDGKELKNVLPDAIQTGCSKCNDLQKKMAKKITSHLIEHKRSWWNELETKYDPEGAYRKKFEVELKKEGFQV